MISRQVKAWPSLCLRVNFLQPRTGSASSHLDPQEQPQQGVEGRDTGSCNLLSRLNLCFCPKVEEQKKKKLQEEKVREELLKKDEAAEAAYF